MATILLSAGGAALGASVGGSMAGLSTAVIGRAVGATLGRVIDQRLMGQGSDVIDAGQVDRFRLLGAGEGDPLPLVYGRMRVGGQVIWASEFSETAHVSGGGKGAPAQPRTRRFGYRVSLAIALSEGEVTRIGRIWANGEEIPPDDLNLRLYSGSVDQLPDPMIEAIEGAGNVPAYRGTAYVVIENLELEPFGNRVPQFSFEVTRPEQPTQPQAALDPVFAIQGVTLIPGTGEYGLATTPVHFQDGPAARQSANINTPSAKADFSVALDTLNDELPNCGAASLVVSWFGNDLRCGACQVQPKVESRSRDGVNMPWQVSGVARANAAEIALWDGRLVYGGTPSDQSVLEAIAAMKAAGKAVMFYPFILMDQLADNTLPNPYDPATTQPKLPWRGRITLSLAPGVAGSPDQSSTAEQEVAAFVGTVQASDFTISPGAVVYDGPAEWSFSRFILHNAALCAAAGGVDAFCIGSELRGMTRLRGAQDQFVFVEHLRALAAQVRLLLGPEVKRSYAADWSEYSGMRPSATSEEWYFHLDALWADDNIDFIGIDNYMPLSDWRDGEGHLDAGAGSIYDLDYLRSNVAGGEGFDWYYVTQGDRDQQIRSPITDGAHGEPWVYRVKDIEGWWRNPHHNRSADGRAATPTDWVPMSKPIWFTELGCAAVDKGTNQPNKFFDPRSSESRLPWHSSGARDDLIQMQYLRAMLSYWGAAQNNPLSPVYGGAMVDTARAFVWALDLRPYPYFPNNVMLWNDGENYARGHWINGRISARSLASVVAEICTRAGLSHFDVSGLYGLVRGFVVSDIAEARAALQPLMLRFGFDAVERGGVLVFRMRGGQAALRLERSALAQSPELDGTVEQLRAPEAEMAGRVRLRFVQADSDFDVMAEEAVLAQQAHHAVSSTEVPIALTRSEGRQTAERWLTEAHVARETIRFALPKSLMHLGAGDVIELPADQAEGRGLYRVDRIEYGAHQLLEAVRIEPQVYVPADLPDELPKMRNFTAPLPVTPLFLDLPLMRGDETPHAPHIAVGGAPWPGSVAVYGAGEPSDYALRMTIDQRATLGQTQTPLYRAPAGIFDNGAPLVVRLSHGSLSAATPEALLGGANLLAVGDGHPGHWELIQFETCTLIAPQTYALGRRLRGQFGTEALMPDVWPEGAWAVLIDRAVAPLPMAPAQLGVQQHFRIGPARRPLDDAAFQAVDFVFDGAGLRPYAPCHLNITRQLGGDLELSWIRRSRIDGDLWAGADVPIGEESERYEVTVLVAGTAVRQSQLSTPNWRYDVQMQSEDGASGTVVFQVAQYSASVGPGPAVERAVDL